MTEVAFSDTFPTLPGNMVVAGTPAASTTCGGTVTANAGDGSISFSGGTIAASGTCTVKVDVTAPTAGTYNNVSGAVSSTNGGTGNTASDTLTVLLPPELHKEFQPNPMVAGETATLTFTITNPDAGVALTGVAFSDTYPTGVVNETPLNTSNTCAGALTASAGGSSVSLSGGSIAAGGSCEVTIDITASNSGTYPNTSGNVSSTNGGTGNTTSDTLSVIALDPPSIHKDFSPSPMLAGSTSTLTITITNPNAGTALTGVAFSDTFPTAPGNMVVAGTPSASTTCGGTLTANAGDGSISFSGGTIAASGKCTVKVDVTVPNIGTYNNISGNVTSTTGGGLTGNTDSDSLEAIAATATPLIHKEFLPNPIAATETTTLTFTITNPNTGTALAGVAFSDTFPTSPGSMLVAGTPAASTTCGGTVTAVAGAGSISFSGGTIAAGGNCTVTVDVTAPTAGTYNNTSGTVTSTTDGGLTGNAASDSLTVNALDPPSIHKDFTPSPMVAGSTSTLTLTITNPNTGTALAGVAFSDTFPTSPGSMLVAGTPAASTTCGGTVTAVAGAGSISFSGGTIAAGGNCTVTVDVTAPTAGTYNNVSGNVTSTTGGGLTGNTGSDSLTVNAPIPPGISKSFSPDPIAVGGTSTLTFTITNPNTGTTLTGVAFSDTFPILPGHMVVANTPAASTTCGGTVTANAGAGSLSYSGGTITAGGTCTVTVDVVAPSVGTYLNTSGNVSSTNAGIGNSATNTLTALFPPSISKLFSPDHITAGGTSTLTLTIRNLNSGSGLTGVAFSDTYPTGVVNENTLNTSNSCGGTLTASAGGSSISLSGGSIAAGGTCTVEVDVTAASNGIYTNISGHVSSTNAGTGDAGSDSLVVLSGPSVSKTFTPSSIAVNGISTLTITLTNPNDTAITSVAFTDNYPANLVNAATPNVQNTCGGTITAAASGTSVALSGGSISANWHCTISVNVTSGTDSAYNNDIAAGDVTSSGGSNTSAANSTLDVTGGTDGTVDITDNSVPGDTLDVSVDDADLNTDPGAVETVVVTVVNDQTSESETITLTETGPDTGVFTGTVDTTYGTTAGTNDDGTLNTQDTNTVTVTYQDQLTSTGGTANRTDTDNVRSGTDGTVDITDNSVPGDTLDIIVEDADLNTSATTVETINVTVKNDQTGETETVRLTETGADTGIFKGTVDTTYGTTAGTNHDGTFNTQAGNTVTVTYQDQLTNTGGTANRTDTDIVTSGSDGTIDITDNSVPGDTLTVTLTDVDLNTDPNTAQTIQVSVKNDRTGESEYVTLTETGPDTGVFRSTLDTTYGTLAGSNNDGTLNTQVGDTVTATYLDALTSTGGTGTVTDTGKVTSLSKQFIASNLATTIDPQVTIGEIITFEIALFIGPNTTLNSVTVTDVLDQGLTFLDCVSVTPSSVNLTTSLAGGFSDACNDPTNPTISEEPVGSVAVADQGRKILYTLGNMQTGPSIETLRLRYRVVVLDSTNNVIGTNLNNYVLWSWTGGNQSTFVLDNSIVEPGVGLDKEVNVTTASPGDIVTFTITVGHTGASTTTAYDVIVTDPVPAGLTYIGGSLAHVSGPVPDNLDESGAPTLRVVWNTFALGGPVSVVQFSAVVGNIGVGATITNIANVEWTSLPGDVSLAQSVYNTISTERWYDPPAPASLSGAGRGASITVGVPAGDAGEDESEECLMKNVELPAVGFPPEKITRLPPLLDKTTVQQTDFWLEVPSLDITIPIVGVPCKNGQWDVSWLNDQAGHLEGTAFPTLPGNTVLTGHVYNAYGNPGPFWNLAALSYGDQVIIHGGGTRYIYEIRQNYVSLPTSQKALGHQDYDWVTLLTCQGYDESLGTYLYRRVIQAVLVRIE